MRVEPERTAAVHAQRLEGRTAAEQRLVVGVEDGRVAVDEAAPRHGEGEQGHAWTGSRERCAECGEQRRRLHVRLRQLGLGLRVPDDPAADPEVDPVAGDREGADRQREVEVAVRADGAERAHRRATADGLERGDEVDGGDLRRARDGAAGERGGEDLRERRVRREGSPRPWRRGASRRPARARPSAPASARSPARRRARGRSARGRRSSRARPRPSRPRPGRRPAASP